MFIVNCVNKEMYLINSREVLNNVESNSLSQRSALADGNDITFTHVRESRGAMYGQISVLLSETTIFGEVL